MADNNNAKQKKTKNESAKPAEAKESQKPKEKQFVREKGRGVVKAVLSGDTIVVLHMAQQGPPVERPITLSSLQAPVLGRRKTQKNAATQDEPYAWASREYLRKRVIGKQITYTIEFKNPANNREYGVVFLNNSSGEQQDNIAHGVVANGWAKVKRPQNQPKDGYRPELQELINLEEEAQKAGKGLWNKEHDESAVRPLDTETGLSTLHDQLKGKPQTAIVEQVRTGSTMRVILLPSFSEIMLCLSGVQAPDVNQEGESEPFGRESKFFTEHHILHRDVTVLLEGADKVACYGSISYLGRNLAEELLKNGLGRYVEWSGARTAFNEALKSAEKAAKDKKLRIWGLENKPSASAPKGTVASSKPGKEIIGKVIEVINGSTIVVLDQGQHPHRINLSSVEVFRNVNPLIKKETKDAPAKSESAPKETKDRKEAVERAFAFEAREFVRRRLIGQRVRCLFDYSFASTQPTPSGKKPEGERLFYSVYLDKNNIAVELTEAGWATARYHKSGEPRSRDYEFILTAEERSKKSVKGVHQPDSKAPVFYVNDISTLDVAAARQYLPFFKRAGKLRGVVEFEFSATRVKLFVPKENSFVIVSLAAVSGPRKNDPLGKEAVEFLHEAVHQRDVEFEVLAQDKGGSFIGNIWVSKKNVATMLLEEGFVETHRGSLKDSEYQTEYLIAEEDAKRKKKNLWKNYDEQAEQEKRKKRDEESEEKRKPKQEFIDVVVTEVVDGSRFFVQLIGDEAEQLEELMKNLSVETSDDPHSPKEGELVKAQFVDDAWYRAKVKKVSGSDFEVFYIDYGNTENVPASRIRPLDSSFAELAPQAHEAQLAYIKVPTLNEDYGTEAAMLLRDLVNNKTLLANVEYRDNGIMFLSLGDRDSQVHVNAALVRAGLAKVERTRNRNVQQLIEKLKEEEEKARQAHAYIWEYGDPGSDEEEDRDLKGIKKKDQKPQKAAPPKSKEEK